MDVSASLILQAINLVASGGILIYVVKNEHRLTALEEKMKIVLQVLPLQPMRRRDDTT